MILLVCWLAQAAQLGQSRFCLESRAELTVRTDDALEAFLSEVMRLHGSNTEACTEVFWHHLRSGRWSSAQQVRSCSAPAGTEESMLKCF